MLIITRRVGETTVIGEDGAITVKVLAIKGRKVRIGVEAPKAISVDRQEVFDRKKEQRATAHAA